VLAIAAALALRILATGPVRREAVAYPVAAFALGAVLVAIAAAIAWAAVVSPFARHASAAVALALVLGAAWRARVDHGASRRWPPGSLGLRASLEAIDDRTFYRDQAARHGPVFKMSQFGRPVACVVGFERSHRILVDHADALAPAVLPYNRVLSQGVLRYMTGATHKEEAPVFRAAFATMELAGAEAALRASLRRELAALAADSTRTAGGAYARPAFERWLVGAVSRVFFGLEPDDPRVGAIARHLGELDIYRRGGATWRRRMVDGLAGLAAIIRDVEREGRGGSSRVAGDSALRAMVASDPGSLDRPSRIENFAMIARIATNDLTGLLDWTFRMLDGQSRWIDAVRAHGRTAGAARPLPPVDPATAIVMETLRLEQSEFLYRRTAKPIEVDGRTIPAGWLLRLCVQESHRDPAVFADPDRFDPSRFVDRAWTRYEYSPFGGHTHGCMGGQLSFFLGRLFVEEMALGYDWTVARDGPPERGTRHRDHWRPSAARRVVLRALAERASVEGALAR
jgi:cytochrome P450